MVTLGASLAVGGEFVNIAHRGARSVAPENTLPAFEIGMKRFKADMIELDVHLSKDGIPVVVHDDTLERCSDVQKRFPQRSPWRVGDFTMSELLSLDAGNWFVETDPFGQIRDGAVPTEDLELFQSGRVRIPTLKACLQLAREYNTPVNIELKNFPAFYPGLADRVLEVVRIVGMEKRVLFSSFDHEILLELGRLAPEIPRGALVEQPVFPLGTYVRDTLGCVAFNPGKDVLGFASEEYRKSRRLRKDLIDQAHAAGLKVYVWTVNDPGVMKQMLKIGVDGIFTDFPQVLSRLK
jgi:glycerophosphoryl diester phosphodiesterase